MRKSTWITTWERVCQTLESVEGALRALARPESPGPRRLELVELEDRMLFSAVPLAVVGPRTRPHDVPVASTAFAPAASPAPTAGQHAWQLPNSTAVYDSANPVIRLRHAYAGSVTATPDASTVAAPAAASASGSSSSAPATVSHELVIIDTSVADYQQLVDTIRAEAGPARQIDIVLLSDQQDGIAQISQILAGYHDLSAVHILSHAVEGELNLGSTWLTLGDLKQYAAAIAGWRGALAPGADLLLYGCDLAAGADGRTLLADLQSLTGANLAASSDATGAAALGGNWSLEYTLGSVHTATIATAELQQSWQHLMQSYTVADNFTTASYSNNNGTKNWSGAWTEQDSLGGGATSGYVYVSGGSLHVQAGVAGNYVQRGVDLSTASAATLSFSYTNSLGVLGEIDVQASSDGGTTWHTLPGGVFTNLLPASGTFSADLGAYMSASTMIRFYVRSGSLLRTDAFDNVQIAYTTSPPNTIVVNTTSDVADGNTTSIAALVANPGADGKISLREAILAANNTAPAGQPNIIDFAIGSGPQVINLTSALPTITNAVVIDGTSQTGYTGTPLIEINGTNAGNDGLQVATNGSTIRGLSLVGFQNYAAIVLAGNDNTIAGNYLGLAPDGTLLATQSKVAIAVDGSYNEIGGSAAADRNIIVNSQYADVLINGAVTQNKIQGNYIGLMPDGVTRAPDPTFGLSLQNNPQATILGVDGDGVNDAGEGNVIADHLDIGEAAATNTVIAGNKIGTNAAGTAGFSGGAINLLYGSGTRIGTNGDGISDALEANVIAYPVNVAYQTGVLIAGNYIGVAADGTTSLSNASYGIRVQNNASATIGLNVADGGNTIADNGGDGILVDGVTATATLAYNTIDDNAGSGVTVSGSQADVTISQNSIYGNGRLGIDLSGDTGTLVPNDSGDGDTGPNGLQNYPLLTAVMTDTTGHILVAGSLDSAANATYTIEAFASPTANASGYGEGKIFLGSTTVTTDGSGHAVLSGSYSVAVPAGEYITLTATDAAGNTSEFSRAVQAVHAVLVTTTSDTADGNTSSIDALIANPGADGAISLREAILAANNTAGTNTIGFAIPTFDPNYNAASGVFTLTPASQLPTITRAGTTLDGSTQAAKVGDTNPGYLGAGGAVGVDNLTLAQVARPEIQIVGPTTIADGLTIGANNVTVTGLALYGFQYDIYVGGDSGVLITGNILGASATAFTDPGAGVRTSADDVYGAASGAVTVTNNLIGFAGQSGVYLNNASNWIIQNNEIRGNAQLDNTYDGVSVHGSNDTVDGNLIIANPGTAIDFFSSGGSHLMVDNTITGNDFGAAAEGRAVGVIGAVSGVSMQYNVIANNSGIGVAVGKNTAETTSNVEITQNAIYGNSGLGIDLASDGVTANDPLDADGGPNGLKNFPVLSYAITDGTSTINIVGTLNSAANHTYRIEFFSNPAADTSGHGQGQTYLGYTTVTSDGSGNASFNVTFNAAVANGSAISATNIDTSAGYQTSEFAADVIAQHANQPPVNTLPGAQSALQHGTLVFSTGNNNAISVSDPDAGTNPVQVTLAVTGGTLSLAQLTGLSIVSGANGSGTITVQGTLTDLNNALNGLTYAAGNYYGTATLSVATNDLGNTGAGGTKTATSSVTITVDGLPVAAGDSYTLLQGQTLAASAPGVLANDSDPDGDTLTASLVSGPAHAAAFTLNSDGSFSYTNDGSFNTSDSFTYQVSDGRGGTANATVNLGITLVNHAPTITAPAALQNVTQNSALTFSTANGNALSVADVDGGSNPEQLTIAASSGTITLATTAGLTFTTGTGTNDAAEQFTGTLAAINAALAGLVFTPTAGYSGGAGLGFNLNDQGYTGAGGAQSATASVSILVNHLDLPPVNTVPAGQTTTQNTPIVFSSGNGNAIGVADPDAGSNPVQVALSVSHGILTLSQLTGLTINSGSNGSAAITVTGTLANLNAALAGLSYAPNNGYQGGDTLAVNTNDLGNTGVGGPLSAASSVAITVNHVNVAPVNTLPGRQTVNENTNLVFSSGNGNALTVSDADGGSSVEQVSLAVSNGTLNLGSVSGLNFTSGGNGQSAMTFQGTLANLNAALSGLTYTPATNYVGGDTLAISTNDLGNTGSGGAQSASGSVAITVNHVDVAPVNSVPGPQTTIQNAPIVFSSGYGNAITVADADSGGNPEQVTLSVNHGTLTLASVTGLSFNAGANGSPTITVTGTLANLNAALNGLIYTPNNGYQGGDTLAVNTNDLGHTGVGGPLSASSSVAITVNHVNLAPVNSVPGAQLLNQNGSLVFSSANGNAIGVSDADGGSGAEQITLAVSNGTLTLGATAGISVTSGANGSGSMVIQGTLANLNAALAGLTYAPTHGYYGPDSLSLVTNDLGHSGVGGSQSAASSVPLTVNALPIAVDDYYTANQGRTFQALPSAGVLANDSDPDGDPLTVTLVSGPAHATSFTLHADGSFAYANDDSFHPSDSFVYQVSDGRGGTATATAYLAITYLNHPPVLSGANNLAPILENATGNGGTPVSTLIAGMVTDRDPGAVSGIAVTAVDNTHGTWQYTTDGGATWTDFGTPNATSARLLAADVNTSIRFVPNADWSGSVPAGITFQAWDQTSGTSGGTGDATQVGGTSAFSTAAATAGISVQWVNQAPTGAANAVTTLENTPYVFSAADFGFQDPHDSPANALFAVKITTLPAAGTLTDNGTTVTAGQFVSAADIAAGQLMFTPATYGSGTNYAAFTFQVQDNGGTANGGADLDPTPKSLTINVTWVNTAPVLSGSENLAPIVEDTTTNPGTPVASLIAGHVSDVDGGAQGIAVTGVDNTHGTWQYTTDGGATWNAFGTPSDGAARLLAADAQTYVRFVPNPLWNGTVAGGLTFRAWDQTSGAAGATADTQTNGGHTAFSAATASAGITVTSINYPPSLTLPGPQSAGEGTLVFSQANGNPIVVADRDAGTSPLQVTLTAAQATLALGSTQGLTIHSSTTAGVTTVVITGTLADVNAALEGLQLRPTAPAATLTVGVNDLGSGGLGAPQTASGAVAVSGMTPILPAAPLATTTLGADAGAEASSAAAMVSTVAASATANDVSTTTAASASGGSSGESRTSTRSSTAAHALAARTAPALVAAIATSHGTSSGSIAQFSTAAGSFAPVTLVSDVVPPHGTLQSLRGDLARRSAIGPAQRSVLPVASPQIWQEWQSQRQEEAQRQSRRQEWAVGAAAGLTALSSFGYLLWILRGSSLLAGALSAMPVWTSFDPLPVLDFATREARERAADETAQTRSAAATEEPLETIFA